MAGETTTPLLPCATIDEIAGFYEALGLRTTYRQRRPNGYAVVAHEDLVLHVFSIDGFVPADSYRAELAIRLGDRPGAAQLLEQLRAIPLDDATRDAVQSDLERADDLLRILADPE